MSSSQILGNSREFPIHPVCLLVPLRTFRVCFDSMQCLRATRVWHLNNDLHGKKRKRIINAPTSQIFAGDAEYDAIRTYECRNNVEHCQRDTLVKLLQYEWNVLMGICDSKGYYCCCERSSSIVDFLRSFSIKCSKYAPRKLLHISALEFTNKYYNVISGLYSLSGRTSSPKILLSFGRKEIRV